MNLAGIKIQDTATIAKLLSKEVHKLLFVYFFLIIGTIALALTIVALSIFLYVKATQSLESVSYLWGLSIWGMIGAFLISGYCIKVVIGPLMKIFKKSKVPGTEIKRKDHPELFKMIDEIVTEANCRSPKHVYVYNECNAYVNHRSFWGHLFGARKNLTIGLPLLYTLNKTELKAILSHEFGHFTQKSLSTNYITNLSEYICISIARALEESEQKDAETYKSVTQRFTRFATKIMAKQYHQVAPLNSVLSHAQEYNADKFSNSIAGSEGAISALSKISYFSDRWNSILNALDRCIEDKRRPNDIYQFIKRFNERANELGDVVITSSTTLAAPKDFIMSNIALEEGGTTHPEMHSRCNTITSLPFVETSWDKTPAISLLDEKIVKKLVYHIPYDLAQLKFPDEENIYLKDDLTDEESEMLIKCQILSYTEYFYCQPIFILPEAWQELDNVHEEYESFPLTETNILTLQKYERDLRDLYTLEQIQNESLSHRMFCYFGKKYNGITVPIDEHRELIQQSYSKALEVARHCNYWITKNTEGSDLRPFFNLMCISLEGLSSISDLQNAMRDVENLCYSTQMPSDAWNYVQSIDCEFKKRIQSLIQTEDNNESRFATISRLMNVKEEVLNEVNTYYGSHQVDMVSMLNCYKHLYTILNDFKHEVWRKIIFELIIPTRCPSKENTN